MELYHNSQDIAFRNPLGAVTVGTQVTLRLMVQGRHGRVQLRTWNGEELYIPMIETGLGMYEATIACPDEPILLWYDFQVEDERGHFHYYGNARDKLGGVGTTYQDKPPSFQITVYDPAWEPPQYLREGVMYQIFPDRFARSKPPVSDRKGIYLHKKWGGVPRVDPHALEGAYSAYDFFGGDLNGIREKLPYLKDLGITILYLNPIFRSSSNHRYDTGNYLSIDPLLGTREDFQALCQEARQLGMRVLLDGVFSHTGDDSIYFNRRGTYPGVGAYQSKQSPYYPWFHFRKHPDDYACWWNFKTLPAVNKDDASYREFILGEHGVARHWLHHGATGWRLDVADELPMSFLRELRAAVKAENPDSTLLGEVWEDASNKIAYGQMRCYTLGDTLDSVMNYPLRDAIIHFLTGAHTAAQAVRSIRSLQENYPVPFFYSLMNLMGSHDRARILNVLVNREYTALPIAERGQQSLPQNLRALAEERFLKMVQIFMALPGMPAIYYGDEVGMEGATDPFCRGPFPWGHEDTPLRKHVKQAIALRHQRPVLRTGALRLSYEGADTLVIERSAIHGKDVFGQPLHDQPYILRITRDAYRV
jgi:glycosidase